MKSPRRTFLAAYLQQTKNAEHIDSALFAAHLAVTLTPLRSALANELQLESPDGQALLRQIVEVLGAAMMLSNNESRAVDWLVNQPLKDFGTKTPLQLIAAGDATAVLKYIKSIEAGASG